MGVSRRAFLGTSMAAASAAGMSLEEVRANTTQETHGLDSLQARDRKRLLVVFQGLCCYVGNPAADGTRMMDVGLLSTYGLGSSQEHIPTLAVHRETITGTPGVRPVATDLKYAYFSLKGKRIRFVPRDGEDKALKFTHFGPPVGCPKTRKDWARFDWVLDFRREISSRTSLIKDWRASSNVVDSLIELRCGTLEDESVSYPSAPGNENARQFYVRATTKTRPLKETVRLSIKASSLYIEFCPLTSSIAEGRIELDVMGDDKCVRVTQVPSTGVDHQSVEMPDLAAFWLLTDQADWSLNATLDQMRLPKRSTEKPCVLSSTDGCLCCPGFYYEETIWRGRS